MAENPLFPGTLMEIIEKYPLSRRLDHPNFGEVCKTTFAKGVIADFEKIQDDPIAAKSRVKVEVGGVISDYLPLFYHPKAQFWDTPAPLATAYNEEGGYFEKAWMSFRGGDEVAVMLKEGVPVAVLGFADGVPRIGENILKANVGSGIFFYATTGLKYTPGDSGPDGFPLRLLRECEVVQAETELIGETEYGGQISNLWGADFGSIEEVYHPPGGGSYGWDSLDVYQNTRRSTSYADYKISTYRDYYYYLVPIGPILFWIEASRGRTIKAYTERTEVAPDEKNFIHAYMIKMYSIPPVEYPENVIAAEAKRAEYDISWDYGPGVPADTETKHCYIGDTYAALYSDELYQRAQGAGSLSNRPLEFVLQTETGFWDYSLYQALINLNDIDFSMFARPHTKAELQAAGMWPAGG
jgi:hypothetical protein